MIVTNWFSRIVVIQSLCTDCTYICKVTNAAAYLRLTAAVTQPLGESRISSFLGETADNLNYCTAGLLFVAFLYFIGIVLIICSSEVLF